MNRLILETLATLDSSVSVIVTPMSLSFDRFSSSVVIVVATSPIFTAVMRTDNEDFKKLCGRPPQYAPAPAS